MDDATEVFIGLGICLVFFLIVFGLLVFQSHQKTDAGLELARIAASAVKCK